MNTFRQKKWMIGCIIMAIILVVLSVNSVALYNQADELKKESVRHLNADWYQLYRTFEIVDKNYITDDFQNPTKYQLLVNQTAHHFTGRADDLTINMRNLLTLAYDPLFLDLSLEDGPKNKEEASKLLTAMNDDIMRISKSIVDMQDDEKAKLLDPASSEFIKINAEAKEAYDKYVKLVDDYFKSNK